MQADMVEAIFTLFERFGDAHYGEHASQRAHALQCAELARQAGCGPEMIAAALLHDVGQFMDDAGNAAEYRGIDGRHEVNGAAFLARAFPPEVTEPVRLHVDAKRYLCAAEPGYQEALSGASALSLKLQGGPMDPAEMLAFEQGPFFADAVLLRRFDDQGKRPDWVVPGLGHYRTLLESLIRAEA